MPSRPKSACSFIGPLWVFFTGNVPPFEECCVEHDIGYGRQELELAREQGDLRWYVDMKFKQCIEASYERSTWWDEVCFWAVRHFGWLFWKRKEKTTKLA